MVAIDLDTTHQSRLDGLAKSLGSNSVELATRILVDYLDFHALPPDTDEAWAEASIQMSPEFMEIESWDEEDHGSR